MKSVKFLLLIALVYTTSTAIGQPLTNGMAIMTQWTGASGQYDAFSIFDTQENLNAPLGQNWATTFHTPSDPAAHASWKGTNMGDVFGIAIDNQKNVYFAATKSISQSGSTGTSIGSGGDAGVYKLNANDWSISEFISTGNGANQIPNVGVGIGNICFDKWHNQLLITNFEDGKIYRYDTDGNLLSTFDPFSADNGIDGFAGLNEALWGINIFGTNNSDIKVYFSQWTDNMISNNSVWSVDLDVNGEFSGAEEFCFSLPDLYCTSNPISDLTFNTQGTMYLCEKTISTWGTDVFYPGAHQSRLFEYTLVSGTWNMSQQFGVGNYGTPTNANNTAGGVALSNKQTVSGIDCEAFIWATGDALRFLGFNPADGGQDYIYGITGVPVTGNSLTVGNADYVVSSSIYIDVDYTGNGNSGMTKMSFGDLEIYTDQQIEPEFTISPSQTISPGATIDLSVSGGTNYNWAPAATLSNSISASTTASPNSNTTYTVTGEGACGGKDTVSVTINIEDYSFTLGPDQTVCQGSTTGTTIDAGLQNSYSWTPGMENTQSISVTSAGIYGVTITTTNNCSYFDEIEIIEGNSPQVNFSTQASSSCPPGTFQLTDESNSFGSDAIVSWNWQTDGQTASSNTTNFTIENEGSYDVSLEVTSELGCKATLTIPNLLTINPLPQANFSVTPNIIDLCNKTVEINNFSSPHTSISLNLGYGTTIDEDTLTTHTYAELGKYIVGLALTNEFDCKNEIYQTVSSITDFDFNMPNAFTPNEDGLNDVFYPNLYCVENYSLTIVDRWGEEIFKSTDLNEGWDGTFNNQLCQIGLYAWKIKYDGIKINQVKTGEVHVMH